MPNTSGFRGNIGFVFISDSSPPLTAHRQGGREIHRESPRLDNIASGGDDRSSRDHPSSCRQVAAVYSGGLPPFSPPPPEFFTQEFGRLERIWECPQTTARDRKRLLGCLVEEVTVQVDRAAARIEILLHWRGGRVDEFDLPLRNQGPEPKRDDAGTVDLLRRLSRFYPDPRIAIVLNRQKRRTARGLPFTASRVAQLRRRHGIAAYAVAEEPANQGAPLLSVQQAAAELGVTDCTLYRWVRNGMLPTAHPDVGGAPCRIRLSDEIRGMFCAAPPAGFVPLRTAVARLGVSRQTIWQRVRSGQLRALQVTRGAHRGLYIRMEPKQPPLLAGLAADEDVAPENG